MGIGRACAELLSAEGAAVVITDRETDAGKSVAEAIEDERRKKNWYSAG